MSVVWNLFNLLDAIISSKDEPSVAKNVIATQVNNKEKESIYTISYHIMDILCQGYCIVLVSVYNLAMHSPLW